MYRTAWALIDTAALALERCGIDTTCLARGVDLGPVSVPPTCCDFLGVGVRAPVEDVDADPRARNCFPPFRGRWDLVITRCRAQQEDGSTVWGDREGTEPNTINSAARQSFADLVAIRAGLAHAWCCIASGCSDDCPGCDDITVVSISERRTGTCHGWTITVESRRG
jgi:hypothetical protein